MMCVTPVNISDEKLSLYFLNSIICCTCNIYPGAVEQATEIYEATTRENLSFWVSDRASLKPVSSA